MFCVSSACLQFGCAGGLGNAECVCHVACVLPLLQVPQLEERDRVCWQMVQQLAALNMSNQGAVKQLMATVVKAEAVV